VDGMANIRQYYHINQSGPQNPPFRDGYGSNRRHIHI
jgi:hypothetical protein